MTASEISELLYDASRRWGHPLPHEICQRLALSITNRLDSPTYEGLPPGAVAQLHRERYEGASDDTERD